ncbi:MAG: hypothetical protein K6U04_10930 [Armatimonadetes bacterium]|nr:hypothetical protein [Armatimonadota bacterium]
MHPFISLVKTSFNVYYGISALKYKYFKQKKELWRPVVGILGGGAGLLVLMGMYFSLASVFYAGGKMLGQPWLVLEMTILLGELLVFFFGLGWIISVLYFSNDLPILLPLPLKPQEILLSKFLLVLTNQYVFLLFVFLPPFLIYGRGEGAGFLYYLTALAVFLFAPVIPQGLGTLLVLPLMNWASKKRARDFFTVLTYVLSLGVAIGIQFLFQKNPFFHQSKNIAGLTDQVAKLAERLGALFPPAWWATKALAGPGTGEGLTNLLLFLSSSLVIFLLLILLGQRVFLGGIRKGLEISTKRTVRPYALRAEAASPFRALLRREWKLFIRTPVYVMNVIPAAIFPVFFVFFVFFVRPGGPSPEEIKNFLGAHPYVKLAFAGVAAFNAGAVPLAATAVSREGKLFGISKAIPVRADVQVRAKLAFGLLVNLLCFLPFFVPVAIVFFDGAGDVLLTGVLSLSAMFVINVVDLLIDLNRPNLDWDTPQKAMQGNLNVLFSMLSAGVLLVAGTALTVGLSFLLPWWAGSLAVLGVILAAEAFLYRLLVRKAQELYRKIEV